MKPPLFRRVLWSAVLFQLAIVAAFAVSIAIVFGVQSDAWAFFFGALTHAIVYRAARAMFAREHMRGIRLVRAMKFAKAAPCFEASYAAFNRHPWIDRFRWLMLGTASSMPYREMALCNAAFCYGQVGDGTRATALYEQALHEFPNSVMATAALNLLRSVQNQDATQPREVS